MPPETQTNPMAAQEQARLEHQHKLDSDPTRQFLRDQGFGGDPKVSYSLDVITAKSEKGMNLTGSRSFDNFEDLQGFIKNNPDALTQKQKDQMKEGIAPFGIGYDKSVYDWSSKLPPEQAQQFGSVFDKFSAERLDPRKWEGREAQGQNGRAAERPAAKTSRDIVQDINRSENAVLGQLNSPELALHVGESAEIDEIVRTMGASARQFENPDERTLASMANKDLEQLNQLLNKGTPENLSKADQVIANYIYRNVSKQLTNLFNRADLPMSWEDKKKLIDQSLLADKIAKRPDGLKSRDLLSLKRRIEQQIGQYRPGTEETANNVEAQSAAPAQKTEAPVAEKRTQSAKEKAEESKTKFGTVLNNFTRQFQRWNHFPGFL